MAKSGKVKATVAGVAVAATVAAASVGGGSPTPEPRSAAWTDTAPGSVAWSDAVTDLQNAVDSLMNVSAAHGVELPESPGINDLVEGMDGIAPVDGYTTYAVASASGVVGKGDPVRYALEPTGGIKDARSVGLGNCTILAMSSGAEDWTNSKVTTSHKPQNLNSAWVYTSSNGNTGLQVMNKNGAFAYATLCAGSATSADVYCNYRNNVLVAYSKDGVGTYQAYKLDELAHGSLRLSLIAAATFAENGNPANIRFAYDSMDDLVSILCTKADETGTRYGAVFDVTTNWECDAVKSVTEIKLTADVWPELTGLNPDTGAKGWDICIAYPSDVMVTCPTVGGGQALIWTRRDEAGATVVKGYVLSKVKGGVDAAMDVVDCGTKGRETIALFRTVNENGAYKVYMELLWERKPDGKPAIVLWGYVPGSESTAEIGQLRICNNLYMTPYTNGVSMVSWVTDGGLYASTVEISPDGAMRRSPAVRVADTSGVGAVMERNGGTAKAVYEADGLVYEGYVIPSRRVSSCEASEADGYALGAAQAGASIQFMRTKTW